MYKPLPESLTIKPSGIDGLGLFANEWNCSRIYQFRYELMLELENLTEKEESEILTTPSFFMGGLVLIILNRKALSIVNSRITN